MSDFDAWNERPVRAQVFVRTFGSWAKALKAAGVRATRIRKQDLREMVTYYTECWREIESQPSRVQLESYLNRKDAPYRWRSYKHAFGSLQQLAERVVAVQEGKLPERALYTPHAPIKTKPAIPLKLRYRILIRDHQTCVLCGASPGVNASVTLQVDHIIPESRGGKTVEDNLRTLCFDCNQGKKDDPPPANSYRSPSPPSPAS